jgi:hypothetical protein
MPIRVIQYNERVAEVQFVCDYCSRLVKTSLIPRREVEDLKSTEVACWNCKHSSASKN